MVWGRTPCPPPIWPKLTEGGSLMARIGVFVCWCGANIAEHVAVRQWSRRSGRCPKSCMRWTTNSSAPRPGQEIIAAAIREHALDGVVVASCSPRMHEATYRRVLAAAGLNPYLMEMANIREHVSWVTPDRGEATEKAVDLVRMKVRKVACFGPWPTQDSRDEASDGDRRRRVRHPGGAGYRGGGPRGGPGRERAFHRRPYGPIRRDISDFGLLTMHPDAKMVEVAQNDRIKLLSYSEVQEVAGFIGNFKVKVRRKARYVEEKDCTGCGDCVKACPVKTPDAFQAGLSERAAIYRPFPQAVPGAFVIDKRGEAPCVQACPAGVNVQGYLALTAQGKFAEALALIRRDNPFPAVCGRVCTHPCEAQCNRRDQDEPLAIRQVKRFLADREAADPPVQGASAFPVTPCAAGERVAVIGAGPAGLTAAVCLAQQGYKVTVFEREGEAGGLLRNGIPAFRLPREVLDREIDLIRETGVEIRPIRALAAISTSARWRKKATARSSSPPAPSGPGVWASRGKRQPV